VSEPRPFAVFDLDGTLIRWQLYHAIADELARSGHIGVIEYEKVRQARLDWKHRATASSYRDYEQTLINLVDLAIRGISVAALTQACQLVLAEYKDQVYTYTRDLIVQLKRDGYLIFAISASQEQIVKLLADYYQFDDFGGSTYEIKDGHFTGAKEVLKRERKPVFLKELVAKHGATWTRSIAVGDSESDIPMLASIQNPVAFNPTRELLDHAQTAGWKVVVERKSVIYELEASNDQYLLKSIHQ
jgi:HAD superfamily hydrolase (TIGR01490 family)